MSSLQHSATVVWQPEHADRSAMARFARRYAGSAGEQPDFAQLHAWSVQHPERFWGAVAEFCGVEFAAPPVRVLEPAEHMADARWFPSAQLNFARQLLTAERTGPALVCCDERGRRVELSGAALREQVLRVASGLAAQGVGPGDRVAAMLPNCAEAVIALLACATLGAVFSSCSPDFGAAALVARFGQIAPRVLLVCDGYSYGGKRFSCADTVAELRAALPSVEQVFQVSFLDARREDTDPSLRDFAELLNSDESAEFVELPFDHPLCILFSSGTTGKPKCIVHSAGGTLVQHLKEQVLHCGLTAADRLLYFTTCGWMMWNWLVSALATGATVVLYDGAPLLPTALEFWQLVEREGVTVFGTSPRFLTESEKTVPDLGQQVRLPALRTVLSTGAPLGEQSYAYIAAQFGGAVQLCSISGGTDIISCFVLGNPLQPVLSGEIQGPGLGMAVAVVDQAGAELVDERAFELGELVCTAPFPSLPLGFWNDADGHRFRAAYFARFPGLWRQGDLARRTASGGFQIPGRADATLNPGGVRMGSAEVCAPALTLPQVIEALAVAERRDGDEHIVLFVVLQPGTTLDDQLEQAVRARIRERASPRHVPARIIAVPALPRTRSGKPMELAVRALVHGEEPDGLEGLANPEALEQLRGCLQKAAQVQAADTAAGPGQRS